MLKLGAAQAEAEHRGLKKSLLGTSLLVLVLTPPALEGRGSGGSNAETAVLVISRGDVWQQMRKTGLCRQHCSVHSGAQQGKAEASSTAIS